MHHGGWDFCPSCLVGLPSPEAFLVPSVRSSSILEAHLRRYPPLLSFADLIII